MRLLLKKKRLKKSSKDKNHSGTTRKADKAELRRKKIE